MQQAEEVKNSRIVEVGGARLPNPLRAQWTRVPSLPFLEEAHILPGNNQDRAPGAGGWLPGILLCGYSNYIFIYFLNVPKLVS